MVFLRYQNWGTLNIHVSSKVLGIEPSTVCMLTKTPATELHPLYWDPGPSRTYYPACNSGNPPDVEMEKIAQALSSLTGLPLTAVQSRGGARICGPPALSHISSWDDKPELPGLAWWLLCLRATCVAPAP